MGRLELLAHRAFNAETEKVWRWVEVHPSTACIAPLFSRSGKLLGLISTHWDHPHQPTEAELRNMDILARQAVDILERQHIRADHPAEPNVAGGAKNRLCGRLRSKNRSAYS